MPSSTTVTAQRLAFLVPLTALWLPVAAQAATCPTASGAPLSVGTVSPVAAGAARSYTLNLAAGEGVIVDLVNVDPATASDDDESEGDALPRALMLCNAAGTVLAPTAADVFEKGGAVTRSEEGQRLRFVAPAAGAYTIAVTAADAARELLVRNRPGTAQGAVKTLAMNGQAMGSVSSNKQAIYSFGGTAGQWVEITATSPKDTLLRLAGPDRTGGYAKLAENDDSDELNPKIRRRLPVTGTYYVQVDGLSDETAPFTVNLKAVSAPPPPAPPAALRLGGTTNGTLSGNEAKDHYTLPVQGGHTYRLEVTAPYDAVVAIGLPNPVESDDGDDDGGQGFSEVKSQDSGTSGTERLTFTARNSGTLLVQVRSFGTGDSNGGYTLTATDLGM